MRAVFVSDAHLGDEGDPARATFLAWLAALEADHLVLGGDIFQHWWHTPGGEVFAAYRPVVEALGRFSLTVLPGNHDFRAPAFFSRHGATIPGVDGWVDTTWDGRRVRLHHGDNADTSLGYAAVSALLRGRPFGALVDTLGLERAWPFLGRLAGNGRVTPNPPLLEAQAQLALAQDADLVIFGHTHVPRVVGRYVNAGAFPDSWVVVEGGIPRLEGAGGRERSPAPLPNPPPPG